MNFILKNLPNFVKILCVFLVGVFLLSIGGGLQKKFLASASSPTLINDWAGLAGMASNLSGEYVLNADLSKDSADYFSVLFAGKTWQGNWEAGSYAQDDLVLHNDVYYFCNNAGGTSEAPPHADWTIAPGWAPIGTSASKFTGDFDGNGHTISDLYVSRSSTSYNGLFGYAREATITGVVLIDVNITGSSYTGGAIGRIETNSSVTNSSVTGTIIGTSYTGGFLGRTDTTSSTSNSSANVSVFGTERLGGFVGDVATGIISNSYSMGSITRLSGTSTNIAGFCGNNYRGQITNSYSTASVHYEGTDDPTTKGFIGAENTGGSHEDSGNYWDTETSGQATTTGSASGKTTSEMNTQGTFVDWDFTTIWDIDASVNNGYPYLRWQASATVYHTVTFKDHDDTTLKTEEVEEGTSATPPADPTRTGYTFTGWDVDFSNVTGSLTITAQYTINSYTLTFDSAGGSAVDSITQNYGTAITPPANPTKTGYTFTAWDPVIPANVPANNQTHTAQWSINSYDLIFQDYDATELQNTPYEFGANLTGHSNPTDPTRTGYTFTGWDISVPATMPAEEVVITAQYTPLQYELIYSAGINGTVSGDTSQLVNYNENGTAVTAVPSSGYYFLKWDDDSTENPRTDEDVTAIVDIVAIFSSLPTPLNVSHSATKTTAVITWSTTPDSSTKLSYGRSSSIARQTAETNTDPRATSHSVSLINLPPCTKHFYRVISDDGNGVEGKSVAQSEILSFFTQCEISDIEEEDNTVEEVAGATGGTVTLGGDEITLILPPNYTSKDAVVQINRLDLDSLPSAPTGKDPIPGKVLNLVAFDDDGNESITTFDELVELIFKYSVSILETYVETTLDVYKYNEGTGEWESQECTLNIEEKTLACNLSGFSVYGVFGEKVVASGNGSPGGSGGGFILAQLTKEKEGGQTTPKVFNDTSGHWAEEYIEVVSEKCGVVGYSDSNGDLLRIFRPNNSVTRAELVKMLVGCEMKDPPTTLNNLFADVSADKWYAPYISYARSLGKIVGYEDGTFRPNVSINRAEALKTILLAKYSEEEIVGGEHSFSDANQTAWYSRYLGFAVSRDFVSGYTDKSGNPTGLFGPSNTLTRAEAAKIIVEVLNF